jgi:arylsulfatase
MGKEQKNDGTPIKYEYVDLKENELYNLKTDPSETKNILNEFPEIVKKINSLADNKRKEIGDDLTNVVGLENREVGMID